MALDGIVIGGITKNLKNTLMDEKINKIYQIGNTEIVIHFRTTKLFISADAGGPSIFLTNQSFDNPKKPPLFSMLLRKHLNGAIVRNIFQYGNDRLIRIDMDAWNEFSELVRKSLIIEIMGRHSNIILIDEDNIIIDSITRVSPEMSRVRQVLPGLEYEYLPDTSKYQPLNLDQEEIYQIYASKEDNRKLENVISNSFTGFSKLIGREIAFRANLDPNLVFSELDNPSLRLLSKKTYKLVEEINNDKYLPRIYKEQDKLIDYHLINLSFLHGANYQDFPTASDLIEHIYSTRADKDRFNQKYNSIQKLVNRKIKKDQKKLDNQRIEIEEAKDRDKYKIWADVLAANLHKVSKGQKSIILDNFYSENLDKIEIPLDVKLSGHQIVEKYYNKYSSLKNAEKKLQEQIDETKVELDYLQSVKSTIDLAESPEDLDNIKNELIQEGYIKRNKSTRKKARDFSSNFKEYSYKGFKILLGRNNRENNLLTFKEASRNDLWFHIQAQPGSHLIIKDNGQEYSEDLINYAARLAAYNSSARDSGYVNVDYTLKQNVKRHPANKPGMVTYTDYQTVYVDSGPLE